MLNGTHRQPVPGPLCASYAPLLPVLDDLTDVRLAEDTRTHLAGCAWCRAQRATYDRFDEALRLHFAPDAMPFLPIHVMEFSMPNIHDQVSTAVSADEVAADDDTLRLTISPLPIPPRPPRRSWRLATGAASLAAVLVISLLAGLIFMSHGRALPPATGKATPTIVPGSEVSLSAVGMSSSTDGWAMGQQVQAGSNGGSSDDPAYVMHYTGGRWVQTQTPIRDWITAIKMLSPTDGWAIGNRVYHYDGTSWQEIHMPVTTQFNAISAVSPSNIWIVGGSTPVIPSDGRAVILHYDGYGWFPQQTPSVPYSFSLYDISMASATEGWAVGTAAGVPDSQGNAAQTGVILRYHSGAWQVAKTLPGYDLRTISMGTATDGWLGGYKVTIVPGGQPFPGGNPSDRFALNEPKLLHFTDGQWDEVNVPQSSEQPAGYPEYGQIESIKMVSATQGWMFAAYETQTLGPNDSTYLAPSTFQLENGHWTQIPVPLIPGKRYATLSQVSVISSNELWGIGECISSTGAPLADTPYDTGYLADVTPLIVHYKDGVWSVVEK